MNDIVIAIGRTFRFYREKKGLRINQMAQLLGYTNNHLGKVEHGHHATNAKMIEDFCDKADVSASTFFRRVSDYLKVLENGDFID